MRNSRISSHSELEVGLNSHQVFVEQILSKFIVDAFEPLILTFIKFKLRAVSSEYCWRSRTLWGAENCGDELKNYR